MVDWLAAGLAAMVEVMVLRFEFKAVLAAESWQVAELLRYWQAVVG